MRPFIVDKETGVCYYINGSALLCKIHGRLYKYTYYRRTCYEYMCGTDGMMFDGVYHSKAQLDYLSYETHKEGMLFYDNLFSFVQKSMLEKLYLSMIPNLFYKKPEVIADISRTINKKAYSIAYKLLQNIPRSTIIKTLEIISDDITDICGFYINIFAMIYNNTDRGYLMSLLFGQIYNGDESIKLFKPNFNFADLLDYTSLDMYAGIHYKRDKDYLTEYPPIIVSKMQDDIYFYKVKYQKGDDWGKNSKKLDRLVNEKDPCSYMFKETITVETHSKKFEYATAYYGLAISNPKVAVKYIRENKDVILNHVLEDIDSALTKKKLEITAKMLKFDNVTVTKDCRLVCKLSLKPELAVEVTDMSNEDKAIKLFRTGMSRKDIAEKLGVKYQTICRYTRGM